MSNGQEPARSYVQLTTGDPAPWFTQRTPGNPQFHMDMAGGRYIVLGFYATAQDQIGRAAVDAVMDNRRYFDDQRACFFGVSADPGDEREKRVAESVPGIRFYWDFDGTAGRLYGAMPRDAKPGEGAVQVRRFWVVIDPTLRVLRVIPFAPDGSDSAQLFAYLDSLPPPERFAGLELQAPVLFLPNVFEPAFCKHLIERYDAHGGEESGFMREVDGKTVSVHDHAHKRRRDFTIEDQELIRQTQFRIRRRVAPEILKVHQFKATRMERYIVCCYLAEDGGHFRAHRDNTTKGTAHRRFAVSINLNDAFEGGEVSFPEYGPRSYRPPPGGAVVFSCSLMHAVSRVTSGKRYAFLPFLYDEEAAKVREQNNAFLGEGVTAYKAS